MKSSVKMPKIFWLLFIFMMLFLTTGYAILSSSVDITGSVSADSYGDVFIESEAITDYNAASETALSYYEDTVMVSNLSYESSSTSYITYQVVLSNGADSVQKFTGVTLTNDNGLTYEIDSNSEFKEGDSILPGESKTITYIVKNTTGSAVSTELTSTFNFDDEGKFYAFISDSSADLTNSDICDSVEIILYNKTDSDITYSLSLDNSKFLLYESCNGSQLTTLTSNAGENSQEQKIYIKQNPAYSFWSNNYHVTLTLSHDDVTMKLGTLTIATTPAGKDTVAPVIDNIELNYTDNYTEGYINVSWTETVGSTDSEDNAQSPVTDYYVTLYNNSNEEIGTCRTGNYDDPSQNAPTSCQISSVPGGDYYYASIYGIDEAGNKSTSSVSTQKYFKWNRTIDFEYSNISFYFIDKDVKTGDQNKTIATYEADSGYYVDSVKVEYLNGTESSTLVENTDYIISYSSGKYTIVMNKIESDLKVTITTAKLLKVTYTGSNVSLSASTQTVEKGASASVTYTVNTGYSYGSVSITNLSGTAYSDYTVDTSTNTITINNITEDLTVTITTKANTYTVTYTGTGVSFNQSTQTVEYGGNVENTYSAATGYTDAKISSVTGTYGNYNASNGTITISNIQSNITVTGTATSNGGGGGTCLVSGTKVLMYDGTYKNIENINYDDLVMVYDHETGKFEGSYPIWIESGKKTSSYQLTTFTDGTTLKTKGPHAVFSVKDNRYVNIDDDNEVNVGDEIYKVRSTSDGYEFYKAKIAKIETIYEDTMYYDVVSTRMYNIITDNVLTNDGRTGLDNFYEFKENLLWSDRREEVIKNNTFLDYNDYSFIPYYLYHGLRAQDGAVIIKYGYMTKEEFTSIFTDLLMNPIMIQSPITNSNGKRVWMVTTSDDKNILNNKDKYKHEENSKYILPIPKNNTDFIGWYNTSDGKMYNPGDTITVYHGMHFVAMYK